MTSLVTGAGGFTGGALVRKLLDRGEEVVGIARGKEQCESIAKMGARAVLCDIRDRDSCAKAVEGCETVYHIAALFRKAGVPDSEFYAINLEGTRNLLDASIAAGVSRFVHCSTIGVCGDIKDPPADETTPYNPGDIYQITKMEGEKLALSYAREGKLPVVVARPAGIYGPGDMRLLKMFRLIKKRLFVILGSGKPTFHMVYIDDLTEGFILCAQSQDAVGEVFIIAGKEYVELNELFRLTAEILDVPPPRIHLPVKPFQILGTVLRKICVPFGIEPPIYRRRVDFFTKSRAFNTSKARKVLGYSPAVDLREGLARTAKWYQENGLL